MYLISSPEPRSFRRTVEPTATRSGGAPWLSMTRAFRNITSSCRIRPSTNACSFFASSYSEFSIKSPNSLDCLMRPATSLRRTVFRWSSSSSSLCKPSGVRMVSFSTSAIEDAPGQGDGRQSTVGRFRPTAPPEVSCEVARTKTEGIAPSAPASIADPAGAVKRNQLTSSGRRRASYGVRRATDDFAQLTSARRLHRSEACVACCLTDPLDLVISDRPLKAPEPAEAEPVPARQRCDFFHLGQRDVPSECEVLVAVLQREQDGLRDARLGHPRREAEVEPEVHLTRDLDHPAIDDQHVVAALVHEP